MIGNQDGNKLDEELSRTFFRHILSGIGYLHTKKIIHRDIKLENILLDKNHTKVVIADFGLSNFWNPGAKLQTRCGSAEVCLATFISPPMVPGTPNFSTQPRRSTRSLFPTARPWTCGPWVSASTACKAPVSLPGLPNSPRLTGRLPFEVEDDTRRQFLIAAINEVKMFTPATDP